MQAPGTRLGRYELVSLLGRGGMGEVWEAVLHGPAGFRKRVALKLIGGASPSDEGGRTALLREARLGALLAHPNVVSTLALDQDPGTSRWIVAMELVRGPTVSQLAASGPVSPAVLLDIAVQACSGLSHIHELVVDGVPAGLVHRDIKPSNLLVDRSGLLKIADLGVAALTGAASDVCGTPGYLAPEVLDGHAGPRSDLFSLGALVLTVAQRRQPFGSGRSALVAAASVERLLERRGFLAGLDDGVPGLADVVRRALRANPADRWPSAAAMRAALRSLKPVRSTVSSLAELVAGDGAVTPGGGARTWTTEGSRSAAPTRALGEVDLPTPEDRFFGRGDVRAEVTERLTAGERLLTLHGPGGMGKTRLSLEVARDLAPRFAGGVAFVDLSDSTDEETALARIAGALGVPPDVPELADSIANALAARGRLLLVLDNVEQVARPVGAWAATCLGKAPDTSMLATSRVPLRVRAERTVVLDPLSSEAAVALFRDRAAGPVHDDDLPAVSALVQALDGLPLAIELAAARTRVIPPAAILERLRDRFRLLRSGDADRPERHQTLEASIDGSWELLQDAERTALCQLATLEAPAALMTAEAVLDLEKWPDVWPLDVLDSLVEHSLLRREGDRFRVLSSVAAYAEERTDPAVRRAAEARHGARFAQLGSREALARLVHRGGAVRLARLARVLPDLIAACRRAVVRGDVVVAPAVALAATCGLQLRGPQPRAVDLLQEVVDAGLAGARQVELVAALARALDRTGELERAVQVGEQALQSAREQRDDWLVAHALLAHAHLTLVGHDGPTAQSELREAIRRFDAVGDRPYAMQATMALGSQLVRDGRAPEGIVELDRALDFSRKESSRYELARAESNRAIALRQLGRLTEAAEALERAVAFHRRLGAARSMAISEGNLGLMWSNLGRHEDARRMLMSALLGYVAMGDRHGVARAEGLLGMVAGRSGSFAVAREHLQRSLAINEELGDQRQASVALGNLAVLALEEGDAEQAVTWFEVALATQRQTGHRLSVGITLGNLGVALRELGHLAAARERLLQALAVHKETGNIRSVGVAEMELAEVAREEGQLEEALERSARAVEVLDEIGDPLALGRAQVARAHALGAAGRTPEAEALLQIAIVSFRELGHGAEESRAQADMAELRSRSSR